MSAAAPLARAQGLELRHGRHLAVQASSFELSAGGVVAVIGPNGSGKSTLLKALAGLLPPSAGRLEVMGQDPREHAGQVAFVMQSVQAPDGTPLTVRDVVTMGRYATRGWFRPLRRSDRERVDAAMERMDVAHLARRHLTELSGGQRQRVYVAQALTQDHDVLMLDEPLTGLDIGSAQRIDALIHEAPQQGTTVVFTTHDLDEAHAADVVVLMDGGVVAAGTPRQVLTREHLEQVYGFGALHGAQVSFWDDPAHTDDTGR